MSLRILSERSQSRIPTPVSTAGYAITPVGDTTVVYDGQNLPKFLLDNGCDPTQYRLFMQLNRLARIGDLQRGMPVVLPPKLGRRFTQHPDA